MILYNRKKVKYRKDGYCWKKRKDGKTTREDHMKLKVQGVEVRGCIGENKSMDLFCAEYGSTAIPIWILLTFIPSWHTCNNTVHTNTHATATGLCRECVVPPLPLPPCSCPCLPYPLSLSLFLKDKSVFGLRPGMMSMPPSAEQRGVSIQSQGSVCAWVCVRVCWSHVS